MKIKLKSVKNEIYSSIFLEVNGCVMNSTDVDVVRLHAYVKTWCVIWSLIYDQVANRILNKLN